MWHSLTGSKLGLLFIFTLFFSLQSLLRNSCLLSSDCLWILAASLPLHPAALPRAEPGGGSCCPACGGTSLPDQHCPDPAPAIPPPHLPVLHPDSMSFLLAKYNCCFRMEYWLEIPPVQFAKVISFFIQAHKAHVGKSSTVQIRLCL